VKLEFSRFAELFSGEALGGASGANLRRDVSRGPSPGEEKTSGY
jgi:hypothetical protein